MKKLNRGWVKIAALIFFAVLGVLTFFSNTILNFSLPEVVTTQPVGGTIANVVRGNANAEALGSFDIEVNDEREVLAVYVRDGDTVEEGQALFRLEASAQTSDMHDQLADLRLQYQRMLIDIVESDYAMQNETIRQHRETLERAQASRNALGAATMTELQAQLALEQAQANAETQSTRLANLEQELGFIDARDVRSARIGDAVLAYEQAQGEFFRLMGMTYEEFILENPDTGGHPLRVAVETTRHTLGVEAAAARLVVLQDISAQAAQVTTANNARTNAENQLANIGRITAADDLVRSAQATLNTALISLANEMQQGEIAHAHRMFDLNALANQISDLEADIRRKEGEVQGGVTTILAEHDGVITNITIRTGDTTQGGVPFARLEATELGYVTELGVTAQQGAQIRPGAQVDVQTLAWWSDVRGRVTGVRPDPLDPQNRRIVNVILEGEVMVGEQLALSIHLSSDRYDTLVPRSALSQDAVGHHVFVLHATNSALGTRYTAVRVDVTVEAEDETMAAVRGLPNHSNVIIRASASISDRDRVRLANE